MPSPPAHRLLVLFAHPSLQRSRVHRRLLAEVAARPDVTLHDLYEAYPDFEIDVPREQRLLTEHDTILLQHPLYWYSTPPLVKQWEDLVLEHGWAYGAQGTALRSKRAVSVVSAGGREEAYRPEGRNRYSVEELLRPLEATWRLCGVTPLVPFVVHGTHRLDASGIEAEAARYGAFLDLLAAGGGEVIP